MTEPVGILAEPLDALRRYLATRTAWKSWLGTSDDAESLAAVYLLAAPATVQGLHAMVDFDENFTRERQHITPGRAFVQSSPTTLLIYIWAPVASNNTDEPDALFDFVNPLGAVWKEMELTAGTKSTPFISSISFAARPERIPPERSPFAGDAYEVVLAVDLSK